jgi:hypothetical protein
MNDQSLTVTLLLDQSPEQVFDAVNNVGAWWSGEIDGDTDRLGAEFTYRYHDVHRSIQRITEFVPGKKVVWNVVDAKLNFVTDKTEWNGTDIVFEIARKDGRTELRFTHVGLVPAFECFGGCSAAWDFYVGERLKSLITTGKGAQNREQG